jgi:hypothetical protein
VFNYASRFGSEHANNSGSGSTSTSASLLRLQPTTIAANMQAQPGTTTSTGSFIFVQYSVGQL